MPKKFKKDQRVKVAGSYSGKVLGPDLLDITMYQVEMLEGPQKGKILSYKPDMLK